MRDASPTRQFPSIPGSTSPYPSALTMNVMRLTAPLPSRANAIPFITAQSPLPSSASSSPSPDELLNNIPIWDGEGAPCGVGYLSVLPSALGSIYASETFRSFLSVFNQSKDPVHNVSVSVHIQTSSQRTVPLLDTTPTPRSTLQPRASINKVVGITLPELGVHKLICAAIYTDPTSSSGHIRTLQQTFSFNVLSPLEFSLSVVPLYKGLDSFPFPTAIAQYAATFVHYLVDLRLLNAVPVPVFVTEATFVPKPPFRVRALLRAEANASLLSEHGLDGHVLEQSAQARKASMGVGDARNFMFHVYRSLDDAEHSTPALPTPMEGSSKSVIFPANPQQTDRSTSPSAKHFRATSDLSRHATGITSLWHPSRDDRRSQSIARQLGHLTVSWRSALGEAGHLDSVVLATEPSTHQNDVAVSIYAVPQEIRTHRPFLARCAAKNNTNHAVRLYLQVRRDLVGEIVPVGISGVSLGEVPPGSIVRCCLTLVPLVRGQHSISGVRVVDIDTNMSYKANPPVLSVL